ncbi:hypothetical protein BCR39DRAFT_472557 [Naematelia encephala]|uniref:Small ribosomal subunit protein mS41 SAM domain-containing protein n=1 Tax=Naematelia encephala TaxID=71784 RepID=A0A1Y2APH4_9TREE|nr:hypothetical protein BCR39DRAFT_472557 [Naematelia encephala]
MLVLRASSSRLSSALAPIRTFSTSSKLLLKADLKPSPETPNPIDLLSIIGRNAEKRLESQAASWQSLNEIWRAGGKAMEDAGLGPRERRHWISNGTDCILWAFSRYSQGDAPSTFVRPPRPPKKIRGWGPKIQRGIRIR